MAEPKLSWRHHYIPQFYLKCFLNERKTFFIYDKLEDKVKDKEYPTKSFFFEENRNITTIGDKQYDFLETEAYKLIDDTIAKLYENIKGPALDFLTPENLFSLKWFISYLFWRVPANDKLIDHLIENREFEELGFTLRHKETGESAPQSIREIFKNAPAFRKIYSLLLPNGSFTMKPEEGEELRWKSVGYHHKSTGLTCTSDNPIIRLYTDRFYQSPQKILFPVTSNKFLFYGDTNMTGTPPREFFQKADLATIQNAYRYVCCPNKDYLEHIVSLYRLNVQFGGEHTIIPEMFKYFES